MKQLDLRYVAHITTLSHVLREPYGTMADTMRQLVAELDARYPGFQVVFVDQGTGKLSLNAMIYYGDPGEVPISVIDIDQPIKDGGTVTFW
jgi:hypothetical protein